MLTRSSERNFNRRLVSFWFCETQGSETREDKQNAEAWVYLSR